MSRIAIIYWTGTGNTLEMAKAIEKGAKGAGADVEVFEVESFGGAAKLKDYDGLMFGCPAMGDEVLEEGAFEPFFAEAEGHLVGVPVHFSVRTAGAAVPGWSRGPSVRAATAPNSSVMALPSRMRRTMRHWLPAKNSAPILQRPFENFGNKNGFPTVSSGSHFLRYIL
jgi:hypothetical protein